MRKLRWRAAVRKTLRRKFSIEIAILLDRGDGLRAGIAAAKTGLGTRVFAVRMVPELLVELIEERSGERAGARTQDQRLKRAMLYQLSYPLGP